MSREVKERGAPQHAAPRRVIGTFSLAMITVAGIDSLRSLPAMAEYGLASVTFFLLAALLYLLPCALVTAELASAWPERGGVYVWVSAAFGPRWGLLAAWLQWAHNIPWFPAVLSFLAGTLAYALYDPAFRSLGIEPDLAMSRTYTLAVILVVLWSTTFANTFGMKLSGMISTIGVIIGSLIPAVFLIVLAALGVWRGEKIQFSTSPDALLPTWGIHNLVFLTSVILGMAGLELSANHAREVKDPERSYPRAVLIGAGIILTLYGLVALSIASVIPRGRLSIVTGLMEAFKHFLLVFHLPWLVPVVAVLIAFGALALFSTQLLGPLKAVLPAAQRGDLPRILGAMNDAGAPRNLLLVQAVLTTIVSLAFVLLPTVSGAFWFLAALATELYLIMYVLLFSAAIRLRQTQPDVPRPYRVPGGTAGIWTAAGCGIATALVAIAIGLFPPAQIETRGTVSYISTMLGGIAAFSVPPLIIYEIRQRTGRRGS